MNARSNLLRIVWIENARTTPIGEESSLLKGLMAWDHQSTDLLKILGEHSRPQLG